jgi:hypothetical protein
VGAEKNHSVLLSIGRAWLTEPRMMLLAGLLWKKTTLSPGWMAEHQGMKNAANVSSLIRRMGSSQSEKKVPETQRCFVSEKNERKRTPTPSL